MMLLDFSGTVIANTYYLIHEKNIELNERNFKHLVLNTIRRLNKKFKSEYGDMVICVDSGHYWRTDTFPLYKYTRKLKRKEERSVDDINWEDIYKWTDNIKKDIMENFPFKMIEVYGAEADDIIGTLVHKYGKYEKIMILSRDKDFRQLQSLNVKQYSPIDDEYVVEKNPVRYLNHQIIRGDKDDGIPNIKSPENSFKDKIRQKPITKIFLAECDGQKPIDFCEDYTQLQRWCDNERLIDLSYAPDEIKDDINNQYNTPSVNANSKVFDYLVKEQLSYLIDFISDFHSDSANKIKSQPIFG